MIVANAASAHGIAGNRYFPGTLTMDDPAVADELILPDFYRDSYLLNRHRVTDSTYGFAATRLLTDWLGASVDTSWTKVETNGVGSHSGFGPTTLSVKSRLYENDPSETLLAASLGWTIGGTGSRSIGQRRPDSIGPGLFFGQGLGAVPDQLSWLRPFGFAFAVAPDLKFGNRPKTVHWGMTVEYSTLYLTDRFTGGPPAREPLDQWVPLVEFALDTPFGQDAGPTQATVNPGLSYVAETWQLAGEALVPLNRAAGNSVGFRLQLMFFLDDFMPSLFGSPVFGH